MTTAHSKMIMEIPLLDRQVLQAVLLARTQSCMHKLLLGLQGSYQSSGQQGSYSSDTNLPTGFDSMSHPQQGYEDVSGQQNGYSDSSGTEYTVDTPH